MSGADALASVEVLAERIATIPEVLRQVAHVALPKPPRVARDIVACGIGASEGPARILVAELLSLGLRARFVPLATFAIEPVRGDLLILFSQNLSPNARLALRSEHPFETRWLVTSIGHTPGASKREPLLRSLQERGVVPVVIGPGSEDGMLLRVVGPTAATLLALRMAYVLADREPPWDPADAASVYTDGANGHVLRGPVALIAAGVSTESLQGLRWRLLEGLLEHDPSVWDVLQVGHGPLQMTTHLEVNWLVFESPRATPLVDRLVSTLDADRARVRRVRCDRDDALAHFAHASTLDACIVATRRADPRNLWTWPGRDRDAPLYQLGEH